MWPESYHNLKALTCSIFWHDLNVSVCKLFFKAKNKDIRITFVDVDLES